jgi:hypothetical protein
MKKSNLVIKKSVFTTWSDANKNRPVIIVYRTGTVRYAWFFLEGLALFLLGLRIRIHIILGSWKWIRIKVKSLIQIHIKVKIQELFRG